MKIKNLLLVLFLTPCFLFAQLQETETSNELYSPTPLLSAYGGFQFQFINFSDVNDQVLSSFDAQKLTYGIIGLTGGLHLNIPNTPFSTSLEGTFSETCPEEDEENEYETTVLVRGFGAKLKQSARVYEHNGLSIVPSMGVGFQKTCIKIDGSTGGGEDADADSYSNKSCSSNYYTEVGVGVEKELPMCAPSRMMIMGASVNYRKSIDITKNYSPADESFVDLSNTNLNKPTLEFYFRFPLFY